MGSLDFSSASSTAAEMGDLWGSFLDLKNPASSSLAVEIWLVRHDAEKLEVQVTTANCPNYERGSDGMSMDEYVSYVFICLLNL